MIGTEGFKLFRGDFTSQTEFVRSNSDPFTRDPLALGIVVISPEMILQVSASVINLGSREHGFLDIIRYVMECVKAVISRHQEPISQSQNHQYDPLHHDKTKINE